jgi:hypothetical protein
MKRVIFSVLFFCLLSFALASIELNSYNFRKSYMPFDNIAGDINITIRREPSNILLSSNQGGEIKLKQFLDANKANYSCHPKDCSDNYESIGSSETKTLQIATDTKYAGFLLQGKNIKINGISFSLESDFSSSIRPPLKIKFFENNDWKLSRFSNEYTEKIWGCYNEASGRAKDALITTSQYCQPINITETNSILIGAKVEGDTKDIKMSLYSASGNFLRDCKFNPTRAEDCKVTAEGGTFSGGTYNICVASDIPTNYKIHEESGKNCGFILGYQGDSVKNYAIFAKTAKFANGTELTRESFDFENYVYSANDIIASKYGGNCINGCFLPIEITGISQNLKIHNITINYLRDGEGRAEKKIHEAKILPASVDFNGLLFLNYSGLATKNEGNYILNLGSKKLFEEKIDFFPAPIIKSIHPSNPPAAVPVNFYLDVSFNGSLDSLNYKWNFSGIIKETKTNWVTHTLDELKDYDVHVEVSFRNLTSKKSFTLKPISPRLAVNISLNQRRNSINQINSIFNTVPSWYSSELKQKLNITSYESKLKSLEAQAINATNDSVFVSIAKEIYSMDFIKNIYTEEYAIPFTITKLSEIEPQSIANHFSQSIKPQCMNEYVDSIYAWQSENYKVNTNYKQIVLSKESGIKLNIWNFNLKINSLTGEPAHLVINKPISEINFKSNVGAVAIDSATIIPLSGGEAEIEYYYIGGEEATFYITPKMNQIITTCEISQTCNFNKVCEPERGENPKTCRSDCKPYSKAVFYIIIAFIIFLGVYTVLQIWYKKNYEKYLFGENRKQIYNLLMFIANARARGLKDDEITKSLKQQGWNPERIKYVMKKSYGKNVGMIEIIPISKISAYLINKKAKKTYYEKNRETLINNRPPLKI